MPDPRRLLRRVDRVQRHRAWLAFPWAVMKKFGTDQGGNLAALITYYGFLSLFPLLLVLLTVLGYVLHGDPHLQHRVVNSALADFPIIGDQISRNVTSLRGSGIGLVIGLGGALYGGLGVANAAQHAMNRVWGVPLVERPGFVPRTLRSLAIVAVLGTAILVTTVLSGIGSGSVHAGLRLAAVGLAMVINVVLFAVAFRILTTEHVSWRDVLPGALVAAVGWEVLQTIGGWYVSHTLRGMSQTYGLFALVLGLLAWIYLQAQLFVVSAEVNVVRARHLWPVSLLPQTRAGDEGHRSGVSS